MEALDITPMPMRHRVMVADDFRMDEVSLFAAGEWVDMSIVLG